MEALYALALGYLLGSVPFGLILTKAFGAGDVRSIGSGSIGATNVLRTGRKELAAVTVLLDAGKGVVAVLAAASWWPQFIGFAAVGAILGHCFPVWLGFKGGKGFATAAGICGALSWQVMLIAFIAWAAVLVMTRISSVSSLSSVSVATIAAFGLGLDPVGMTLAAIALIVFVQHRANIARLIAGTEPKIGQKG